MRLQNDWGEDDMDDAVEVVEVVDDKQEQELKLQETGKEEEDNDGWMMMVHQRISQWK